MKIVCGKPPVSAYNFMRYLCAILAKKGKVIVDLSSITYNIFSFKKVCQKKINICLTILNLE